MMKCQRASFNVLLGVLLAGSNAVWAGGAGSRASDVEAPANIVRRVSSVQPRASSGDAAPAAAAKTNLAAGAAVTNTLPPLPPGVTELKFSEFFRQPIGSRGLEYTGKLRALDGRRIRILGFMARQTQPAERCFLLSPVPLTLNELEYGHADDLPASALHVFTAPDAPARTPYTPGLLLLTGTLTVGNRLEADGRTSTVRLQLDPPTPEQQQAAQAAADHAAGHDAHAGHGH